MQRGLAPFRSGLPCSSLRSISSGTTRPPRPAQQRRGALGSADLGSGGSELSLDAVSSEAAGAARVDTRQLGSFLRALFQFSRPHTMLGTFVSICSISLLALVRAEYVQ